MITQQVAEFNGEAVRDVAGALVWGAQPLEQPEVLRENALSNLHKNQTRKVIQVLTDSFRERYNAQAAVIATFQDRLLKAAKDFPPGQEMDPDDIAVPALEKGEAYFINERKALRDIRDALQRSGGKKTHGTEVFEELERLDELLKSLVIFFQEIRWLILVNDGALPSNSGETYTSGAEFMASLEDL